MLHMHIYYAGLVSKSPQGFTKVMTVVVIAFEAAGLAVSEKKRRKK